MSGVYSQPEGSVSPRGRLVGWALVAVGVAIVVAGVMSLVADFNPPELQLLNQAGLCNAAGIATGANCYQVLDAGVGPLGRDGPFFNRSASIFLRAGDRAGAVVVKVGDNVALPAPGSRVRIHMWHDQIESVELGGQFVATSEVPQPQTDNVGVVIFSFLVAAGLIFFAARLLTGRAGAFDYFG